MKKKKNLEANKVKEESEFSFFCYIYYFLVSYAYSFTFPSFLFKGTIEFVLFTCYSLWAFNFLLLNNTLEIRIID